jgi:hypothetical protein
LLIDSEQRSAVSVPLTGRRDGVRFQTSLPEDRSVLLLLVKIMGKQVHENVVQREPENLNILVQGFMQLRSRHSD